MAWTDLFAAGAAAATLVAAACAWMLEVRIRRLAGTLCRSGILLAEASRLVRAQQDFSDIQALTEAGVDTGTAAVRAIHHGIASIPFGILEAIPVTSGTTRIVRRTHDLIADAVYGTIRGANRALGGIARGALRPDTGNARPGPDEATSRRTRRRD